MEAERRLNCGIISEIANYEVFLNTETHITVRILIAYKIFKQAHALEFFSSYSKRIDIIKLMYLPSYNITSKERP